MLLPLIWCHLAGAAGGSPSHGAHARGAQEVRGSKGADIGNIPLNGRTGGTFGFRTQT